jgi:hypothetical protein
MQRFSVVALALAAGSAMTLWRSVATGASAAKPARRLWREAGTAS